MVQKNQYQRLFFENYLTLEFIQSEGKYDGNTVNRRKSVKKAAMQLGNPRGKIWRKKSARWVWASVSA